MQEDHDGTSTYHQCDFMDYIDEELAAILGQDFPGCQSPAGSDSSSSSALINISTTTEPPRIGLEPPPQNSFSNFARIKGGVSNPVILNFGTANSPENPRPLNPDDDQEDLVSEVLRNIEGSKASKRRRVRPPSQTYDHIMAERKRREQLSKYFIALSAIVPGLKKMDKTSVLGDTIKYLKYLQERLKTLEEQTAKQTMESVVLVKKSQIVEDEGSSDEKSWGSDGQQSLPEIEARVCHKSVLLKVQCEKRKGVLVKLLAEVEKLNLAVVNTSVTPFGTLALDITIIAEMDKEISLSGKDIVKALRSALQAAGN